ncbi:MAG: hypothetical protein QOI49_432 [Verrucomicrobiota bacterium]
MHELVAQPCAPAFVPERGFSDIRLRLVARNDEQASQARQDALTRNVPGGSAFRLCFERIQSPVEFCDLFE